jgi:hypothetical protein
MFEKNRRRRSNYFIDTIDGKIFSLNKDKPLMLTDYIEKDFVSDDNKVKLNKLIENGAQLYHCRVDSRGNVFSFTLNNLDKDSKNIIFSELKDLCVSYPSQACFNFALRHCLIVEFLNLRDINSANIPDLSKFVNLKELILPLNDIQEISWFGDLPHLYYIDLSDNKIESLKGFELVKGCPNLEGINLNNNQITELCEFKTITQFVKLRELSLNNNNILELFITHNVPSLSKLSLTNNKISNIAAVKNLSSLNSIDLSNVEYNTKVNHNLIKRLNNFNNLPNLKYIRVLQNPIKSISCLEILPKLTSLRFTFSSDIHKKDIEEIIDYIHIIGLEAEYDTGDLIKKAHILYNTPVSIFGPTQTYTINDFITLKLFKNETRIFVKGRFLMLCKQLLLNFSLSESFLDNGAILLNGNITSIDDAVESNPFPEIDDNLELDSESEFWGHCSNLQVWVENDYNTSLIHSNLAFPLLKELVLSGDPKAKKVFKEEIAKKIASGNPKVIEFLKVEGYLEYLTNEEINSLK